ncbi:hypothetical protein KUCAC02_005205 [Chaenocephalus aceratus]|uniref:Uncharacterized protein n=1 Tax=Chaenocephalus aceratus TaxID=36190 RepID=A0ACB9WPC4_CHAAC|nr:hypothetical protein KUCAC02_005205 [Chaenocephalus aceratus]
MNDYSKATELDLNNSAAPASRARNEAEGRSSVIWIWLQHHHSVHQRHALWGWGSLMVTMVPGSRYVCSTHAREEDPQNDREERILAMLGIIGTILNLLVVIFVYIYTTVT